MRHKLIEILISSFIVMADDPQTKVYYEPKTIEGIDAYIGMVIVALIVILYFAGVCCLSVYLKQQREKKFKELQEAEEGSNQKPLERQSTKKDRKIRKNSTLTKSQLIDGGVSIKPVKVDESVLNNSGEAGPSKLQDRDDISVYSNRDNNSLNVSQNERIANNGQSVDQSIDHQTHKYSDRNN